MKEGEIIKVVILLLLGYLSGSIPFGFLISKYIFKIDIRDHGSGNIGATNMFRTLGAFPGLVVLLFDMAKGAVPVFITKSIFPDIVYNTTHSLIIVLVGILCIFGHNWSVFLKFSGGKGVATAAGVLGIIFPKIFIILFMIFSFVMIFFRIVSLSSVTMAVSFPFLTIYFYPSNYVFITFSIILSIIVVFKHKKNIVRIFRKEETKLSFKKEK